MPAVNRYEDRAHVAAVVTGRDGVLGAVGDGVTGDQMPDGDLELTTAWVVLEAMYQAADRAADVVRELLEESA